MKKSILLFLSLFFSPLLVLAQQESVSTEDWYFSPGIIGTIFLIIVVLILAIIILIGRVNGFVNRFNKKDKAIERKRILSELKNLDEWEIDKILLERKSAIQNILKGDELGSEMNVSDKRALVKRIYDDPDNIFFEEKKKTSLSIETPQNLKNVMLYYLGAGIFWLIFWDTDRSIPRNEIHLARYGISSMAFIWQTASSSYQYRILGLVFSYYDRAGIFCYCQNIKYKNP